MKRLLPKLAIFTVGVIAGASAAGVFIGDRVDVLYLENRVLKSQLTAAEKDIQQLREQKQTPARVVSKISSQVSFSQDCDFTEYEKSTVEMTVEKNLREWLKLVVGQELDTVNYQLVPRIVDNREIEVEEKKIRLKVELVVISENVIVYLEVRPVKKQS